MQITLKLYSMTTISYILTSPSQNESIKKIRHTMQIQLTTDEEYLHREEKYS